MKHSTSCASQGAIGGQGLEFIPCDCGVDLPWQRLVFGRYNRAEVRLAVGNVLWQAFREDLRDRPLPERFARLLAYATDNGGQPEHEAKLRRIRVTNYVHALARSGMIPATEERVKP